MKSIGSVFTLLLLTASIYSQNIDSRKVDQLSLIQTSVRAANNVSAETATANKVTSQLAIDGSLDEPVWDISYTMNFNLLGSDNTAAFGVLWDDNYLYVGINVTDGSLNRNEGQAWYDDGIEICIDGDYSRSTTFEEDDRIFVKAAKTYWIQEKSGGLHPGVIHQWMETQNGYSMEFAIPWNDFNLTPSAGNSIGFNVVTNDDDNPNLSFVQPSQLLWDGTAEYYKNPSTWGTLNLSDQTVSYNEPFLALLNPNGGNFWLSNNTVEIGWVSSGISNVNIELSIDDGNTWSTIIGNLPAGSGSLNWKVGDTPSDQCLIKITEAGNSALHDISADAFTISSPFSSIDPLIRNTWDNYVWPYFAYYPEDPNMPYGHRGNPCGPSALTRILHTWEFPITGNNELTFTDYDGFTWTANFGETIYDYDNMPNSLPEISTEAEYKDVATLFYHAAVSMNDDSGSMDNMAHAMNYYFNYKLAEVARRTNYSKAEWIQLLKNELDNGRVILIAGLNESIPDWHENASAGGHWYNVDGYNEDGQFHVVIGFGNDDGYYDVENFPGYAFNHAVLTGLEPNLEGKQLSLTYPNVFDNIEAGTQQNIAWTSTNIANLRIEFTQDNGATWENIITSTPAAAGTYSWVVPDLSSENCKIKLTDVSNINVYDKSNETFTIFNQSSIDLIAPIGGEVFQTESIVPVIWEAEGITEVDIYYSINGGANWTAIVLNHDANDIPFSWTIPIQNSSTCRVKIEGNVLSDESTGNFNIQNIENPGGPFVANENTALLLSFDNNLNNQSVYSSNATSSGASTFSYNTEQGMGYSIKLDGDTYLSIPHNANLNLDGNWIIEAWIKITSYNNIYQYIFNKLGDNDNYFANYAMALNPWWGNILFGFYFSDEQTRIGVTDIKPELNQWYHVSFTRDVNNSTIEVVVSDNTMTEVSSTSTALASNDVLLSSKELRIGEGFIGYIDELRITTQNNMTPINGGGLTVLCPNGGEVWEKNSVQLVTWEETDAANINIEYCADENGNWINIAENVDASAGQYAWTVPLVNSQYCQIRISSADDTSIFDTSDDTFTIGSVTDVENESKAIPKEFSVSQNYPNPFNPTTLINYSLPKDSFVEITVFDLLGQTITKLVSELKNTGYHQVQFDAHNLNSGIYFYTITAGEFMESKKMMLVK